MFRDLTKASNVQEVSLDDAIILPGQTTTILEVPVALNEIVYIAFEYAIRDRRNRTSRVGTLQTMANGHISIPDPVPSAHITTDAYGEAPSNMSVDVRSSGSSVQFQGVNALPYQEPMFVNAKVRIVHVPEFAKPRIRLTITGLSGGENWQGLGNGVHILEADYYYRSPYGGSDSYTTGTLTLAFTTLTQCEEWNYGLAPGSAYDGRLNLGLPIGWATSSHASFFWHNGTSIVSTYKGYSTGADGFAQDAVLGNSFTTGGVTFTWEREPGDKPGAWGQY